MAKIIAAITMSVDGYITGPDNSRPGQGPRRRRGAPALLGHGRPLELRERAAASSPEGEDAAYLNEMTARGGAIVVGQSNMYEAAGHWGDKNPFGMPVFVVTHRPEEEPGDRRVQLRRGLR